MAAQALGEPAWSAAAEGFWAIHAQRSALSACIAVTRRQALSIARLAFRAPRPPRRRLGAEPFRRLHTNAGGALRSVGRLPRSIADSIAASSRAKCS